MDYRLPIVVSMSFPSFVALRYLAASRRRAHVALISTIAVLGLAVGVAALVISLSLLSGFQDRIRAQMAERSPHLVVSPERGARLADAESVRRLLAAQAEVAAVAPSIAGRAWVADPEGESALPVRYRNAAKEESSLEPSGEGSFPLARVSGSVAARTGVSRGGRIRVTSSRTRLSPLGPIPVTMVFQVADVMRIGALEKAADVEVSERSARLLAGVTDGAGAYEARLRDPERAEEVAARLAPRLPAETRIQTWKDLNAPLSFALRLEKLVIFVTVALVILVAALNIVSNVALLVVEKKRDLGVLASLGATPEALGRVYLTLGALIGLLGTAAGVALGVTVATLLDRTRAVPLPADVYLLTHVPFAVHPGEVFLVAVFALATAVGAAVLPARAAARLAPGEALRLSR
ncbi:MAG: ABC transporter permease [Thermoanaerobaculia bacterium]